MSGISPTQLFFEFLKLIVVFGILKLIYWDLLFKDYWEDFKKSTQDIAESLRENDKHKKK